MSDKKNIDFNKTIRDVRNALISIEEMYKRMTEPESPENADKLHTEIFVEATQPLMTLSSYYFKIYEKAKEAKLKAQAAIKARNEKKLVSLSEIKIYSGSTETNFYPPHTEPLIPNDCYIIEISFDDVKEQRRHVVEQFINILKFNGHSDNAIREHLRKELPDYEVWVSAIEDKLMESQELEQQANTERLLQECDMQQFINSILNKKQKHAKAITEHQKFEQAALNKLNAIFDKKDKGGKEKKSS